MTKAILLAQIIAILYPNLNRLDIYGDMEHVGSTSSKYSIGMMRTWQWLVLCSNKGWLHFQERKTTER